MNLVRLGSVLLVSALVSCSSDDSVERSAEAFCARYEELAEAHDADVKTGAPVDQSSPDEIESLADRSPDDELTDALEELAVTQPEVLAMMESIRAGDIDDAEEVDRDLLDRYVIAGRVVLDARHRLCDDP